MAVVSLHTRAVGACVVGAAVVGALVVGIRVGLGVGLGVGFGVGGALVHLAPDHPLRGTFVRTCMRHSIA